MRESLTVEQFINMPWAEAICSIFTSKHLRSRFILAVESFDGSQNVPRKQHVGFARVLQPSPDKNDSKDCNVMWNI